MAQLDVSDIILDPVVAGDTLAVIRREQVVNNFGEAVNGNAPFAIVGAVYPTGDNSLVRQDAFQTQSDTITVVTTFPLRGPGKDAQGRSYDADVVVWSGNQYTVKQVNDYSQYGTGFVEAECVARDFNIQAPGTPE